MLDYNRFFKQVIGRDDVDPLRWQVALAENSSCESRLIRIPTGFGKTLGVVSAWLWNRIYRNDEGWPRRLLWCLPMRVLVEQTEAEVRAALLRLGKYWANGNDHADKVGVHLLMGGADAGEWHLHPEHAAVLIGTQDMLLSRALNRGYGSARARWPMDFGLLNQDSLWVMDEVQLMDVGLATSGQLQAFRQQDRTAGRTVRPSYTWWMSATLQRAWLEKSPETKVLGAAFPETSIPPDARTGLLWETIDKPVVVEKAQDAKTIAKLVVRVRPCAIYSIKFEIRNPKFEIYVAA